LVHEFRNRVEALLVGPAEVRSRPYTSGDVVGAPDQAPDRAQDRMPDWVQDRMDRMPDWVQDRIPDRVEDRTGDAQGLSILLALAEAAARDRASVIADLDDVLERALQLAGPALGMTSVVVHKQGRTGVANRGNVLESLLAVLLVDLVLCDLGAARAGTRPLRLDIQVEATRGTLFLAIESSGAPPSPDSSWFALACDLGARVRAGVSVLPDGPGYLVRFS
jgi:hypothetical protein